MPIDNDALLQQIAVDVAVIKNKLEENDKLQLAKRVAALEIMVSQFTGGRMTIMWLITTGIAVYAAFKH
jgi:hypothetical protein